MNNRNGATYLLAASLFSLAGAIVYFSWEIAQVRQQIPSILASVEQTSSEIEPVVKEVAGIRDLIPPILKEVEETRKLVSPILEEVRLTREQIPSILQESGKIREQIPPILQESGKIREQIPSILKESGKIRKQIPPILKEVEKTREAIPPMMNRADKMIASARTAGQEASKGAVTGVFTGILTAPFAIVGNVGKKAIGLTDEEVKDYGDKDLELLKQAGQEALMSGKIGVSKSWKNPESGYSGKMTLVSIDSSGERECRVIRLQAWKKGDLKKDRKIKLCLNDSQQWEETK